MSELRINCTTLFSLFTFLISFIAAWTVDLGGELPVAAVEIGGELPVAADEMGGGAVSVKTEMKHVI